MRTKHLILSLIAFMAIFLASCSEQQPMMGTEVNGTQTFTFSLTTDGQAQTRAAAPVVTGYKLKYFLQVLDADGTPITGSSTNNDTGTFNVSLPVGAAYTCLFWAHYIPESSGDNEFFNTGDLKAVTLKQHLTGADHCQAFSGTASIAADQAAGSNQTVLLKRAVAQVNIKTDTKMEGYSKLTARYTDVPNTFNVQDNTVAVAATGSVTTPSTFEVTTFPADAGADGKFTYQSAYFLASADGVGSMLKLEIKTYRTATPDTPLQTLTIANVTTKKNYKTNILASFDPANLTHAYTFSFEDWNTEAIILPSVWNGQIPAANPSYAFGGKDGSSAENAYVIASAADLAQLAANVNAGTSYESKYFKQIVDIDLNNHPWTPIGKMGNPLKANYDGQIHKITGLKVNKSMDSMAGLFGYVTGNIVIKNIHVTGDVRSGYIAGGICGRMSEYGGTTSGTISGCSFKGIVEGTYAGGGICGTVGDNTIIVACANYGTVFMPSQGGGIVGVGQSGSRIAGCYNVGDIQAETINSVISGIGGEGSVRVIGCYNTGVVSGSNNMYTIGMFTTDCFADIKYGTRGESGTTLFSNDAWPAYNDISSPWYVDAAPDGSYSYDSSTDTFSNCKFWKSGGSWNNGNPEYPKLWWED